MTLQDLKILKNRKIYNLYVNKRVVYKITNLLTYKVYIGITSRIKRRIVEHIKYSESKCNLTCYLHHAIIKYGMNNFIFEILDEADTDEELNKKEEDYIYLFKSDDANFGYNLTSGGNRGTPNKETMLKKVASSHKKKIAKYDLDGNLLEVFESVKLAQRITGIPDTDLHRCHRNKWSRNGFMFRKFDGEAPQKIEKYESNKGKNFAIKGRKPHNILKCALFNKESNQVEFEADSLKELASKSGLHTTTLDRINKNPLHKKWKLLKK